MTQVDAHDMLKVSFTGKAASRIGLGQIFDVRVDHLDEEAMTGHASAFVQRDGQHPLSIDGRNDVIGRRANRQGVLDNAGTCPIAYGMARHAGIDPAAILVLGAMNCEVEVNHPDWDHGIRITHGELGDEVCWPLAPGMLWTPDTMTDEPTILMLKDRSGLPDTVTDLLAERLPGTRVRDFASHPVLDAYDLRFGRVDEVGNQLTMFIEGVPDPVSVADAMRRYDEANGIAPAPDDRMPDRANAHGRADGLREMELLAFALRCSAENPAAIGCQRHAVELLERLGIEPREQGTFFNTREADIGDAIATLTWARPPAVDIVDVMAEQLATTAGERWADIPEIGVDDEVEGTREHWRRLARTAFAVARLCP